jgi:hypothetical protein
MQILGAPRIIHCSKTKILEVITIALEEEFVISPGVLLDGVLWDVLFG